MYIRDDFRRDGIAATFKVSMTLYHKYLSAFPPGTRINIGYPSICKQEYSKCSEILNLQRSEEVELSTVGHARAYDLKIMEELLRGHPNISANIWIPSSDFACNSILNSKAEDVLKTAIDSIEFWKKKTDIPLDIALTDITNDSEINLGQRVIDWHEKLMNAGYRSVILCDTKGVGNIERLRLIFGNIGDFEWHPHDDEGLAKSTTKLAIELGATHVGTSFLKCSERMNMLDPRDILKNKRSIKLLNDIVDNFHSEVSEILDLRDIVYGKNTFVTGTHFKLWGKKTIGNTFFFGVTSDSQLFKLMTGEDVSSTRIANLKDQLLYNGETSFITQDELHKLVQIFNE